ncbi:MFS transporter [Clostridium saccharoperbutylacetonicum]|uniref:MFS transporter n=1 Tax=Clostridium saccharoperbutylacetonicum TaxID=36745 RepID=UPI000983E3F8|nr:MFS transporter [Clostridium saccharoperbutylacetonicum]AQR97193.1 major facilitator superfamily protein [Clostridium saccharoperbutylacetonicum]NSB33074.1 MFS family permease [Clostridium saccharoperbutylacetonicum]
MRQKSNNSIKISIFSIAFVLGLNITGVAPILGMLDVAFKEEGANAVQTLQTIPYFLLMVASILVGWLVTKISKRKIVSIGLLLIAFVGTSPLLIDSFSFVMISRVLVGFGFGIISPLNAAIISDFFDGKDRAALMGLHVTGMGIGSIFINIVGGILGNFGYQKYFLVHLIALAAFIIVIYQLPDTGAQTQSATQKLKLNKMVFELSLISFFHTLFITAFMTNIATHILQNLNGSSALTGIVTAVQGGFALLVGFNFSRISSALKRNTLPFAIFAAGLGYLSVIILPHNILGILFGSACLGISLSCFMAQASYIISVSVPQISIALANGVFAVIGGIGGLLSPIIINNLTNYIFKNISTNGVFIICAIGMFVLSICSYILVIIKSKNAKEQILN